MFKMLLVICMSSLEKCHFWPSTQFLVRFIFFLLNCRSSLYILDINSLSHIQSAIIFFCSVGFFSILLMISFAVQKLFSLMVVYFAFVAFACGVRFQKSSRNLCQGTGHLCILLGILLLQVSNPLTNFQLIFCVSWSNFILLVNHFSQNYLLKRLSFPVIYSWLLCHK